MSLTGTRDAMHRMGVTKVTPQSLLAQKKSASPITAITAYDYPTARFADEAGIDLVLVGDSVGMAVLGHDDTLSVTLDDMVHHTRAVRRAIQRAFLVTDMPFGTYQVSIEDSLRNAIRLVKESGCEAVKIEGGAEQATTVRALTQAQIPVVAHIGLTPQSVHAMGGYRVQGRTDAAATRLLQDAHALEEAGAIAIVLEGIPRELGRMITSQLSIPTIGIGAGPECDGQILVFHDLFGLSFRSKPKFVRQFADAAEIIRKGLSDFRDAVESHAFPADAESYHMQSAATVQQSTLLEAQKGRV